MKKDLGSWALDNSKLVAFLLIVLVCGGMMSYYNMSKLEDPEIAVKQAMVVTVYPGASPYQVELEVTDVLEKGIRQVKYVSDVTSRSMNDMSMITVELAKTCPDDEVQQVWDNLRRKVNDLQSSLPDGARQSIVKDDFGDVFGLFYAMTSDGFDYKELSDYANYVKREINTIEGISNVVVYGERKKCINISLYEDKMANLGVLPLEVINTMQGQNKTVYSGYFETADSRIKVAVNDKYTNVDDISNVFIQGHEDDQIRLRDIAKIEEGWEEPVRNEMFYDSKPALGILVSALHGTDITKIGVKVDEKIKELQSSRIPAGISFNKVFFQSERVTEALNTFLINLVESVIIVVLALVLTMGLRSGLIIGATLVFTVIGSFAVLSMLDGTLQRVSLGAFILAMGMLVDNAIVIIDGIDVDLQRGVDRRTAMISIGQKTAMPLFGATLIAILAFLPIFMSPDTAGTYVRDLFIVLAVSLLLSWVLALTYVPLQASISLTVKPKKDGDEKQDKFTPILRKILMAGLSHRVTSIIIAVVLILISAYCYKFLKQGFFPDMNYNQLYIEYKLHEGSRSDVVRTDLEDIEKYLMERSDIQHVTRSIGGTPGRYNLVRSIAEPSMSYGELIVDFESPEALVKSMDEIQVYLTENYPQAYVRLKRYNLMYKKYPVEVMFKGPDPAVLRSLVNQATEIMRNSDKNCLVTTDWEDKVPYFEVDYNQPVARAMGLSRGDVGTSLLASAGGIPMGVFYDGNSTENIYVKTVSKDGKPIESLSNVPVFAMIPAITGILDPDAIKGVFTGAVTKEELLGQMFAAKPLSQATNGVSIKWDDPMVLRSNSERAMRAQSNPMPGCSADAARADILEAIEAIELPEGYTMSWEGEYRASQDSMRYLFKNFPLAIVLIIAILIMLFNCFRKPIIIMCCIPLIFVGVVPFMLITGKTFGFVAIVGVLGLIGMIVKNGVILMDEIALQLGKGGDPVEALLTSSVSRFRPVMMASLTTILGMIPLLTDDFFGSIAVTIMGGLFIGTIITLLFIPILYAVFFKIKVK